MKAILKALSLLDLFVRDTLEYNKNTSIFTQTLLQNRERKSKNMLIVLFSLLFHHYGTR